MNLNVFCGLSGYLSQDKPASPLLMCQQKQLIFHPFIIPERFLTTTGVKALGSEDCVFMKLRIQEINWTLPRLDRAAKCEKTYIFATSLRS